MRRVFASILLIIVVSLGASPSAARAEGNTITIEQNGYTYTCSTQASERENLRLKINEVQYTCYSEAAERTRQDAGFFVVVMSIVLVVVIVTMFIVELYAYY